MLELVLPWPPAILSPNARPHWAAKSRAAKSARAAGFLSARVACNGNVHPFMGNVGKLHLFIDFHPPSARRIDDDNCLSRFKNFRDGIADYLGIDDARFISHPLVKEKVAGGCVKVRITVDE